MQVVTQVKRRKRRHLIPFLPLFLILVTDFELPCIARPWLGDQWLSICGYWNCKGTAECFKVHTQGMTGFTRVLKALADVIAGTLSTNLPKVRAVWGVPCWLQASQCYTLHLQEGHERRYRKLQTSWSNLTACTSYGKYFGGYQKALKRTKLLSGIDNMDSLRQSPT